MDETTTTTTTTTVYGRDAELVSLKQAYRRSIFDQYDAAIIFGEQGVGKSSLAHEFIKYAKLGDEAHNSKGCVLLSGKFDNILRAQSSQQFSPILSAFNKYCEWLSPTEERSSLAKKVSCGLMLSLGQEACALVNVIPNLAKVIGAKKPMNATNESDSIVDAKKMLQHLLSQFADVICRSHDAPLLFFMDNLQWADTASITLLKQIMLVSSRSSSSSSSDSSNKSLENDRKNNGQSFFLGCHRNNNKMGNENDDLWKIDNLGLNVTKIEIDCLDKEAVNLMISNRMKMLPLLTSSLANIVYRKTEGNPSFVIQLMTALEKGGSLCMCPIRSRWIWDEKKIEDYELGAKDVVSYLAASLGSMSSDVLAALCTLSCFGSCSDRSLVELENELGSSHPEQNSKWLSGPLDRAVAEGVLNKKDGQYQFVNDRVKDLAYDLIDPEERCLHHFNYGLALCSVAERNDDDGLFLMAVGQINLGGPKAADDGGERSSAANYNLVAGKKARTASDFFSAYWFYDYGISYLEVGHWTNDYDLSLALYDGAAECALVIGEHAVLSILTEQIMHYAKCIEDKLHIFDISVRILMHRSDMSAAIACGIEVLSKLGEDFPKEVTPDVAIHFIEETNEMLDDMTNEKLIDHKAMSDSNKIMAMNFLTRLFEAFFMIRPSDQPIVVLKMVQLSVKHGMSPMSPLAFALYGSFLASMGNIHEGYRYARIAKALLEKIGSRRVAGAVIAYSTQLMAYAEPVQSVINFHIEGGKAAMKSGDTMYADLNAFFYDSCSYWSGKKLRDVMRQLNFTLGLTKQSNHVLMLVQVMSLHESISKIIGISSSTHISISNPQTAETEKGFDSMINMEKFGRDQYFNKMHTAFLFRQYSDMKTAAKEYSKSKVGPWIFVFSSSIQSFYEGLVSFWIGRDEEDNDWIARGKNSCKVMENMANTLSKWNFENKALLLRAEEQYCDGNLECAETLYDDAVSSAKLHRFLNEEALASELAGIFYLKTGRKERATTYLSQAVARYREWEAWAKADSLEKYLNGILVLGS